MSGLLKPISNAADFRQEMQQLKAVSGRVGFVPTMGALHEGHLSLIETARAHADAVACSIFVNPKQFDRPDDLNKYPQQLDTDLAALERAGVRLVFVPTVEEMYPAGFQTTVSVADVAQGLCGGTRPGHFDGVATVVCKFLLIGLPDVAIFGEKDFQQLMVIRRVVQDLSLPVEIVGSPTVRAADGLALSSRNQHLSQEDRALAPLLPQTLLATATGLQAGGDVCDLLASASSKLESEGFSVDYFELRDGLTLAPLTTVEQNRPARLLAAAWLGKTRLIDNLALPLRGGL